jgi:hypothetical protein
MQFLTVFSTLCFFFSSLLFFSTSSFSFSPPFSSSAASPSIELLTLWSAFVARRASVSSLRPYVYEYTWYNLRTAEQISMKFGGGKLYQNLLWFRFWIERGKVMGTTRGGLYAWPRLSPCIQVLTKSVFLRFSVQVNLHLQDDVHISFWRYLVRISSGTLAIVIECFIVSPSRQLPRSGVGNLLSRKSQKLQFTKFQSF